VTGVDFSARFINAGRADGRTGRAALYLHGRRRTGEYCTRTLADMGLDDVRGKVDFFQGDACNLKPNSAERL
jgi:hypothetical protein